MKKFTFASSALWSLYILLIAATFICSVVVISGNSKKDRIEKEIVAALENNTEDQGDYVIALMPTHDNLPESTGTFYYAIMMDNEEDVTLYSIRYVSKNEIYIYTIEALG